MKTDLTKILSVSGQRGLFLYVSQARNGIIAESIIDKSRTCFGLTAKMTTLSDISIYTDDEEVKLQDVLTSMHKYLEGGVAPSSKSKPEELKALFDKALPNYDKDRFYVSHMKKVVDWYNVILEFASFDFETKEENTEE